MRNFGTTRRQVFGLAAMGLATGLLGGISYGQSNPGAKMVLAADPPLGLTTSEGAGVELVSLKARAVVQEPLAFTELHLVFHNPENRVREGRFRITLPPGAVISRFAMKVQGAWQEGEVVEKQAARRAYEDFLHRRQDPALMETEAGNEFSARIFPIPANADKELIVSYSQELADGRTGYRLPLRGLPRLGELDVRVLVARTTGAHKQASSLGGATVRQDAIEVRKRNFLPDQDLVVEPSAIMGAPVLRHENLVVARINALGTSNGAAPIEHLTVLFDTSASRALGFSQSVARLQAVVATLAAKRDFALEILAFDQELAGMFSGKARGFSAAAAAKLLERRAEGASDLESALKQLRAPSPAGRRLLLVSDGVATAGSAEGDVLLQAMKALTWAGFVRADVMAVGGIRDDEQLGALVASGLPAAGVVIASDATADEAARRLLMSTRTGLKVEVPGATWVWPTQLNGVQPGDEVLVYADLPAKAQLQVMVGGQQRLPAGAAATWVEKPLLERAWVKARIARLQHQSNTLAAGDADLRRALAQQMVELSVQHRVLCNLTALLVLETEQDYARFNIHRRGLADILTVGATGIEVVSRKQPLRMVAGAAAASKRRGESAASAPLRERPQQDGFARPEKELAEAGEAANKGGAEEGAAAERPPLPSSASDEPLSAALQPRRERRKMADEVGPQMEFASKAEAAADSSQPGWLRSGAAAPPAAAPMAPAVAAPAQRRAFVAPAPDMREEKKPSAPPLTGKFASITLLLKQGQKREALAQALAWRAREPGDVLAVVALGHALEAGDRKAEAARVYGSIIDLFPGRADLRRFAAGELERLGGTKALALAVDCLAKAAKDRPDHPSSHHLLAMARLQNKQPEEAFAAVEHGLAQPYPPGRFAGAERVLQEDLGLTAAAWIAEAPKRRAEILQRLERAGGSLENAPSIRFVLTWETDANDVDFHIRDGRGGHTFYSNPILPSGGQLYADVTTGYGPECFTVRGGPADRAYPYSFQAHYYSKGPMGYGLGRLQIIDHDGKGNLRMEARPFVVMTDGAYVDLGGLQGGKQLVAPKPVAANEHAGGAP